MYFMKSRQNIGQRPFDKEERQQRFSDRFRVEIAVFSDIQTFSEPRRDFSSCPAMLRPFQRLPEIFISVQLCLGIFRDDQKFS